MSHFNLQTMLTELSQFTDPIQVGPVQRQQQQRKKPPNKDFLNVPSQNSRSMSELNKTPSTPSGKRGLSMVKTPSSKTPHRGSSKTPKKTPSHDRFIPSRATTDIDRGHYALMNGDVENNEKSDAMSDALANGQPKDARILHFRDRAPNTDDNPKVLYSKGPSTAPKSTTTRQIRQQPERILDAPDLRDDYYLNLIDWASSNHMVVALGNSLYLWNGEDGTIAMLMELSEPDEYITSVKVMAEGPIMGVASSSGDVQLWDIAQEKRLRTMTGHSARVATLSWNTYILSSGARSGLVHHHDVRVAEHKVGSINAHLQEVCGLSWSQDGRQLASGGNDNMLYIWDAALGDSHSPLHRLNQHSAAVKAISWCPWQPQVLASGGGMADRHIRIWNTTAGTALNSVDTKSQVSAILWSAEHKELISGHGNPQNQLSIWKYPALSKVTDLKGKTLLVLQYMSLMSTNPLQYRRALLPNQYAFREYMQNRYSSWVKRSHKARILSLAMSPDSTTVVSAAADETLRMWKCFEKKTTKTVKSKTPASSSLLTHGIR